MKPDDRSSVRLRFSPDEVQREHIDSVKAYLRDDPKVRAMGQPVTDQVALRYALTLGLEKAAFVATTDSAEASRQLSVPTHADHPLGRWGPIAESATPPFAPPAAAPEQGVPAVEPEEEPLPRQPWEVPAEPVPELYARQPHWEYFDQGEWEIPDFEEQLHRYYDDAGWIRCAAAAEGVTVQLYWTPRSADQDLPVWPGPDAEGRTLTVQTVPEVGTAHVIPQGFGGERDAMEGAVVWSPG